LVRHQLHDSQASSGSMPAGIMDLRN